MKLASRVNKVLIQNVQDSNITYKGCSFTLLHYSLFAELLSLLCLLLHLLSYAKDCRLASIAIAFSWIHMW